MNKTADSRNTVPNATPNTTSVQDDFFLPDFCNVQALLRLLIVAELLVLVWVLGSSDLRHFDWYNLGLTSFFVQWLVVICAALLCRLRGPLGRLPLNWAAAASFLLIIVLTLLGTLAAQWLFWKSAAQGSSPVWDVWQILRNMLIGAVMAGISLRYLYLQQQLRWQQQAELRSRIEALQARIRPHFLFNSMNCIASLIAVDPDKAEQVVEDLSELFRASLNVKSTEVTFAEELALCRKYVGIEQLRLGDRLRLVWDLAAIPDDMRIPSLILQPLMENAIYHGIQPRPDGGQVTVTGQLEKDSCVLRITNPLPVEVQQSGQGNRVAVDNIRHRLVALYGELASLSLQANEGCFVAVLRFPARRLNNDRSAAQSVPQSEQAASEGKKSAKEDERDRV